MDNPFTSHTERAILDVLTQILHILQVKFPVVRSGRLTQLQGGANMAIKGILAGQTGTFVASWFDGPNGTGAPGALPSGVVPVWTSSDPTNAPVVVASSDPTGNTATVTVPTGGPSSGSFTLTATATLADGTTPSASATVPYLTPEVESGVINQTS